MTTPTHITTSGGLISATFIENVREPGSRQRLGHVSYEEAMEYLEGG